MYEQDCQVGVRQDVSSEGAHKLWSYRDVLGSEDRVSVTLCRGGEAGERSTVKTP